MMDRMEYTFDLPAIIRKRGLTAAQAASIIGVSRQAIYPLMRPGATQIRFETINKICAGLDVTPAELFRKDGEKDG